MSEHHLPHLKSTCMCSAVEARNGNYWFIQHLLLQAAGADSPKSDRIKSLTFQLLSAIVDLRTKGSS